ncbi:hypothetical protein M2322_003033 [Rhodoblastus acidophilus]|uniref:hypothetical protein n=1 Tax=Rhodoblastus acidophilus TaxID=1074 RepID=UPI002225705D|nr:hypothetical protein [Rhodoblastus acidophilus]MCW2317474.1 hypothetical protein [Rhodoblastus acidophilus]
MSLYLQALQRLHQTLVGSTAGGAKTNTSSVWRYATDDAAATVETAGYFNGARSILTVGDVIIASMVMSGVPVNKQYVVLTVPASGNVTIGLQSTAAG